MVGLFIQTLPTTVHAGGGQRIARYLSRTNEELAEEREHQWISLAEVQRYAAIGPGEELFDTLFVLENFPVGEALESGGGLGSSRTVRIREATGYRLAAQWTDALSLRLEYDARRVSAADAERVARLHERAVRLLLHAPADAHVFELDPLLGIAAGTTFEVFRLAGEHWARDALERALDEAVARRAWLTGRLEERDGVLTRVPWASGVLVESEDESGSGGSSEPHGEALERARQWARRAFDTPRDGRVRARLVRTSDDEQLLVLAVNIDHAEVAVRALAREAAIRCAARAEGRTERELDALLASVDVDLDAALDGASRAWWTAELEGAPPALDLPTDRPRLLAKGAEREECAVALSAEVAERVAELARREELPRSAVLLAGWSLLLARYARREDVVVACPVARVPPELEDLAEAFASLAPVRVDLRGRPTFRELVRRVEERIVALRERSDVPLATLASCLGPEPSTTPCFQSVLRVSALSSWEPEETALATSEVDVALTLVPAADGGYEGALVYDAALFERETAERMARRFEGALAHLVEHADDAIETLELATSAERSERARWSAGAPGVRGDAVARMGSGRRSRSTRWCTGSGASRTRSSGPRASESHGRCAGSAWSSKSGWW